MSGLGLACACKQSVEVGVDLVDPALRTTFFDRRGIYFGCDAHYARDIASLGLCTRHASQTRCDEQQPSEVFLSRLHVTAPGVEHSDCCAVYNALRTYVHI